MCNKIDEKLLIIYKYLQEQPFSREDVSEVLGITSRQLSRLMKQWANASLLNYQVGVGRGVLSEVTFNENIEQLYVSYIINHIEELSFEDIKSILKLPLYTSSKALIESVYYEKLVSQEDMSQSNNSEITYIDFIYRIPQVLDPLNYSDVSQDVLLFNVMDRLYEVDDKLTFSSAIVSHESVDAQSITIYLHHDIKFSNGKILFATDVVQCLKYLFNHPEHHYKFSMVESIEEINLFCIKINYQGNVDYLKLMLSAACASIYIIDDDEYIGTGAYKVNTITENYIAINARTDSHHQTPDISVIYLINNYDQYMSSFKQEHTGTINDKNISQKGFVCFNPLFTKLNKSQRAILIDLTITFFNQFNSKEPIELKPPSVFKDKIVIGTFNEHNIGQLKLCESLNEAGFNVTIKVIHFNDIFEGKTKGLQCDMFFLGHTYIEDIFYYSLMNHTNIRLWFVHFNEIQCMLEKFRYVPKSEWITLEQAIKKYLEDEYWFHTLMLSFRKNFTPINFKNVNLNNDGLLIYKDIIVV